MDGRSWWRLGKGEAHSFGDGSGWATAACGQERWTVRWELVERPKTRCPGCVIALTAGEAAYSAMTESEARFAFGDR